MKTLTLALIICSLSVNLLAQTKPTIIQINNDIQLIEITTNFYIHLSFTNDDTFGRFSSNGAIVIKNGKALMIDTPVNMEDTKEITNYLANKMNVKVTTFIGGHYHNDCIGGMQHLKENGVMCVLGKKTKEKCIAYNLPLPDTTFEETLDFIFEDIKVNCRYFGGGHTNDNIVVYFPDYKILFGGCLIKSLESKTMGNIADAVLNEWGPTVIKVQHAFNDVKVIIPGHGEPGGKELLTHTIQLVTKNE